MSGHCSKPCKHCPFRTDVRPFLHPARASQIAESVFHPWATFACHETTDHNDDGEHVRNWQKEKICAGWLSLKAHETGEAPGDFQPSDLVYTSVREMEDAYTQEWNRNRPTPQPENDE